MSALLRLLNAFGIAAFEQAPQPQEQNFTIDYASLVRVFQLLNEDIFDIETNIPTDEDDIQVLAHVLSSMRAPAGDHLADSEWTKIELRSYYARNDAASITFVEYTRTIKEVGEQKCATILMSTSEMKDGIAQITPLFSMTGNYTLSKDGSTQFVPISIICLVSYSGEDVYYMPATKDEFKGTIAYANDTFLQLLSGSKIKPYDNQKWMEPKHQQAAADLYEQLMNRTAHSLAADISPKIQ